MPPKTAAGKARALANLRQNRTSRTKSSAFGMVPGDAIEAKRREVEAILHGDAGGWFQPSDSVTIELLARVLARLESIDRSEAVDRWLRRQTNSTRSPMGIPGFVQVYLRLLDRAHRLAESLGLSPISRNRLGIVAGQGFDIAAALAAPPRRQ